MSNWVYKVAILLSLAGIMVTYNNCGAPFGKPGALKFQSAAGQKVSVQNTEASIDAFTKTVYPITRANCINCHMTQTPTSAHQNPQVALNAIVSQFKVNFDNIPASRLVRKLRDEGHNCWGDCNKNADEMQDAIEKWALTIKQIEAAAVPVPAAEAPVVIKSIITESSRSIATELLDPKNKVNLITSITFDISAYLGFPNAYFVIDVIEYDEYSYKFSKPRIKTPTENVYVSNVKILINGKYDPQNALYTVIEKTTTAADRILSASAMVAFKDKGPDIDQLSISFDKLRLVTTQTQSHVAFEDTVYQVTRANCSSCHSGTTPAGHASPDVSMAHDVVISRSLVNFTTVTNSPLYRKLKVDRHNCGLPGDCDDIAAEMQIAIEEWKSKK
ncbi:MAG TPA: hypothetical protein VNJ08_08580 [Bacteriovoracaceae bacterium]|nr:hypothetical protein [Bacteriovoracaceae bacterium]